MWYWFATKFPTDQFMVFAFAGRPDSVARTVAELLDRARSNPFLAVRIHEDRLGLQFPHWVPSQVGPDQCVVHELDEPTWSGFLAALAVLTDRQLDPRTAAWRLHVFTPVVDVPGSPDCATIVVLQISHALGDGPRSAALAGYLFGRDAGPSDVSIDAPGGLVRKAAAALRARRALDRDTEAGLVPPVRPPVPALSTNHRPTGQRILRTLVRPASDLPGPTPTVGALVAVSEALSGYLSARGEDPARLTAAVPMTRSGVAHAYNHIDTALVGLHPDAAGRAERIRLIAADLVAWRQRSQHPAFVADERAFAAIPAPLRRLGIRRINSPRNPTMVPGNTVVSSVDRGPADLSFGGCRVLFTAGYPLLLPILNLAHGVHRIGDTVAVSVHATTATDVDEYVGRLEAALSQ